VQMQFGFGESTDEGGSSHAQLFRVQEGPPSEGGGWRPAREDAGQEQAG
jgi:hypothetical protein